MAGIDAEQLKLLTVQPQAQEARTAGIDDPPALHGSGLRDQRATGLAVDHDDVTFASQHPVHLRCRAHVPIGIESDVGDHQEPFPSRLDDRVTFDDDRAVKAGEQLLGDMAVVMRVVPEHTRWVVETELVFVVEAVARRDHHEHVVAVALGRDDESVSVNVRLGTQLVADGERDSIAGTHPERRAWQAAVVGQRANLCSGYRDVGHRRGEGEFEEAP